MKLVFLPAASTLNRNGFSFYLQNTPLHDYNKAYLYVCSGVKMGHQLKILRKILNGP